MHKWTESLLVRRHCPIYSMAENYIAVICDMVYLFMDMTAMH